MKKKGPLIHLSPFLSNYKIRKKGFQTTNKLRPMKKRVNVNKTPAIETH